jgi:hypothetical protein
MWIRQQILVLAIFSFSVSEAIAGPPPDPNEWRPDAEAVARIDPQAITFVLPKEFGSIAEYSRYYWGTVENGRRVIQGAFVPDREYMAEMVKRANAKSVASIGKSGLVHIVPESDAPTLADGGCMIVWVTFDVGTNKITNEACNYELPPPPPPPPSH